MRRTLSVTRCITQEKLQLRDLKTSFAARPESMSRKKA
jgi:hypothetical protein